MIYFKIYIIITLPIILLFITSVVKIGFVESSMRLNDLADNRESDE